MVWWFSKTNDPKADNRKVLQPYSDSMKSLLKNGYKAKLRPSGHDISEKFSRDNGGAIPSNMISIANTESNSAYLRACRARGIKPHPARYPEALVRFFLNFLTDENDLVIDPFGGSIVTGAACEAARRRWLATEISSEYLEGSTARFDTVSLFDTEPADEERPTRR
jgi:site-specific DNA-methyltransferase (cytosine-N4-specific)